MSVKMMEQIKGHDKIKAQIKQALEMIRLPHALLFSGPSGVGKRQMVWALAQSLLCEEKEPPCGECYSCISIPKKQNENVLCVNYETLQIRLQDVRGIPSFLSLQSFAKAKVVLIDSAEKLNPQASNFLLKMIEEPPPKSFFFLISSEPSKLSLTIRSRIQNLRFQTLPESVIRELVSDDIPEWMIQGSRGRMDVIEELKNQKEIRDHSFDLWSRVFENSFSFLEFSKNINHRKEAHRKEARKEALLICCFWQQILRDARLLKSGCPDKLIHGDRQRDIKKLSALSYEVLDRLIKKTLEMEADLRANADYTLCFENFVIDAQKINSRP